MSRAPTVELVFDPGCPHVEAARESLRTALAEVGLPPVWTEHTIDDPSAPAHTRGYGSPTILIDGRDAAGEAPTGSACCRVYHCAEDGVRGVPPVGTVIAALKAAVGGRGSAT